MRIFSTQQTSKNFSQTFESPRVTLPDVAFPFPDIAALCLSLLIRCISLRYPSLPLHIGAAHLLTKPRLTFAFQSVPMQSLSITLRGIPLRFRCRSALRFAPLSLRKSVRRLAVPCPCSAMPCNSIQFHSNASPLDTSPFPCSARPHYTLCRCVAALHSALPYLCVATRFSTNPLHSSAVGSYSPPCLCFAKCFHAM